MDERSTLEERLTATYLRALKPDCFDFYKPRFAALPSGWIEAHMKYEALSDEKRSEGLKVLMANFGGYIKACGEVKAQNNSDVHFLTEMKKHFEKLNLPAQADKCRQRIHEFEGADF